MQRILVDHPTILGFERILKQITHGNIALHLLKPR